MSWFQFETEDRLNVLSIRSSKSEVGLWFPQFWFSLCLFTCTTLCAQIIHHLTGEMDLDTSWTYLCFRLGAIDCLNKAHCLWNPSIAYFPVSWSTSSWLTNLTSLKSLLTVRSVVLLVSSIQTNFLIWFDLSGSAVKPGAYVLVILLVVVWMNFVWFFLLLLTLFRSYLLSCLLKFDGAIFFLSVLFVRSDSDCQPASLKNVKPTPVHYFTLHTFDLSPTWLMKTSVLIFPNL